MTQWKMPSSPYFPSLTVSSGSLEGLKWLAMIFMTIDHANRIFFDGSHIMAYRVGRLAMPLFSFVFAYNLARSGMLSLAGYFKISRRLIFFGLLSTPAYLVMMTLQGLFPLNILFTFLVVSTALYCYDTAGSRMLALVCFLGGGWFVEYHWFGVMVGISFWLYCKSPSMGSLLMCFGSLCFLDLANDSHWTLLSIPIIVLAAHIDVHVPRWRYFFWSYYPIHLTTLIVIKKITTAVAR
jgi:hypothetical protein